MRIDAAAGPSNPYHLSRVYGVKTPAPTAPAAPAANIARVGITRPAEAVGPRAADSAQGVQPVANVDRTAASASINRLIAAVVPGRVDFSGDVPQASPAPLAFYRHPADKNAAATGVQLGRTIDLSA